MTLILASQSSARRQMLDAVGIKYEAIAAHVDEGSAKQSFVKQGLNARDMAAELAALKANKISARFPDRMVIGADQLLETSEGLLLDKPQSVAEAKAHLELMRGTTHRLISAAVIAYAGTIIWRSVDSAQLMMRRFSDQFLDTYLTEQWPAISHCVGCYQLEGAGLQLFSKIEGSHFTILGLPLLPLCDFLRVHGVLPE